MTSLNAAAPNVTAAKSPSYYCAEAIRYAADRATQIAIVSDGCRALALPMGSGFFAALEKTPLRHVNAIFALTPEGRALGRSCAWRAALAYQYAVRRLGEGLSGGAVAAEIRAAGADFPILSRITDDALADEVDDAAALFLDPARPAAPSAALPVSLAA